MYRWFTMMHNMLIIIYPWNMNITSNNNVSRHKNEFWGMLLGIRHICCFLVDWNVPHKSHYLFNGKKKTTYFEDMAHRSHCSVCTHHLPKHYSSHSLKTSDQFHSHRFHYCCSGSMWMVLWQRLRKARWVNKIVNSHANLDFKLRLYR